MTMGVSQKFWSVEYKNSYYYFHSSFYLLCYNYNRDSYRLSQYEPDTTSGDSDGDDEYESTPQVKLYEGHVTTAKEVCKGILVLYFIVTAQQQPQPKQQTPKL